MRHGLDNGNRRSHLVGVHRAAGSLRTQNSARILECSEQDAGSCTEAAVKVSRRARSGSLEQKGAGRSPPLHLSVYFVASSFRRASIWISIFSISASNILTTSAFSGAMLRLISKTSSALRVVQFSPSALLLFGHVFDHGHAPGLTRRLDHDKPDRADTNIGRNLRTAVLPTRPTKRGADRSRRRLLLASPQLNA